MRDAEALGDVGANALELALAQPGEGRGAHLEGAIGCDDKITLSVFLFFSRLTDSIDPQKSPRIGVVPPHRLPCGAERTHHATT